MSQHRDIRVVLTRLDLHDHVCSQVVQESVPSLHIVDETLRGRRGLEWIVCRSQGARNVDALLATHSRLVVDVDRELPRAVGCLIGVLNLEAIADTWAIILNQVIDRRCVVKELLLGVEVPELKSRIDCIISS